MPRIAVASALSLSTVSTLPSANCLQWTDDGQLLLLTKLAVYILTPDVGIIEMSSVAMQMADAESAQASSRPVGWLRTMIGFDKILVHSWPADCQDWGAVSLGSLDPALRAATFSPSNLTVEAGCLLAVLNSNMELTLWGPVKNHLRGEWNKLMDITAELRANFALHNDSSVLVTTMCAQSTCVAWSSQTDFDLMPAPHIDGSLLAIGNRAGSVSFLRFSSNNEGPWESTCIATIPVSDRWVNFVGWSSWRPSGHRKCEAFLACGTTDGSVVLLRVIQTLRSISADMGSMPGFEIEATFDVEDVRLCKSDDRSITSMKWVVTAEGRAILVHSKPGVVHLWASALTRSAWSGSRTFAFSPQKHSIGSSPLCAVSGIAFVPREDALVISLTDGSFNVIHAMSTEPSLTPPSPDSGLTSGELSLAVRSAFIDVEPGDMAWKDLHFISGMTTYDDDMTFTWIHEARQPTDFSYKHEAKHNCMFVVAQLLEGAGDENLLSDLQRRISHAKAYTGKGPLALLRSIFFHLQDPKRLSRMHRGLLEVLQHSPPLESVAQVTIPPYTGEITPEVRQGLRRSIAMHLFGWDALLSQRMRFLVAELCKKSSDEPEVEQSFSHISGYYFSTIWHHVLRIMIRHVGAILGVISSADLPFVLRIIAQASLPGSTADLVAEANDLLIKLKSAVPQSSNLSSDEVSLVELCPACHAQIPLQDISTAICPNGHTWVRCCVTSFLLATPMVRTCIGCRRKAFLPLSQQTTGHHWLPENVRNSWLVADVLDATRRCCFCGSNFVMLV